MHCRGTLVARFYVLNFIIIIFAILIIILVCRGYSFGFVTEGVKNPSNGWFLAKLMEKGVLTPLRYALIKKTILFGNFSQNGGGVFPNPKTFVNLPSIFLYAKFNLSSSAGKD